MNYIKYFQKQYERGVCDCWTLIQEIYKDEHDATLPDYPYAIEGREAEFSEHVKKNIELKEVTKADKGCIIYMGAPRHHAGYAVNDKQYIHSTYNGVKVDNIPRKAKIYKVIL